jgi:hypothetical protein
LGLFNVLENGIDKIKLLGFEAGLKKVGVGDKSRLDSILPHQIKD